MWKINGLPDGLPLIVIPDTRNDPLVVAVILNTSPTGVITVFPIPAPITLMFLFDQDTPFGQLHEPAGTNTVSPSTATLTAVCTLA